MLEQLFFEVPPLTRAMCTLAVVLSMLVYLDAVAPWQLYLNLQLITKKFEIWRVFTNIFFFGEVSLHAAF
jgi:Derlin-2/3